MKASKFVHCALFSAVIFAATASAQPTGLADIRSDRDNYSPYLNDTYPNQVFYGDTHLHTAYSTDAGLFGNTIGPDDAYRFAKGEEVTSSTGVKARLMRPLDFLVVADHAENLGLSLMVEEKSPALLAFPWGKKFYETAASGDLGGAYAMWGAQVSKREDPFNGDTKVITPMWERIIDSAESHNNPGSFTAFIGFEWTSTPGGNNLHRNVIFRDNGDKARQVLPYSVYDSDNPEDLWAYLANYEKKTGGKVLALAHNGNLSNGLMFDDVTYGDNGKPLDRDYAERRIRWEPLYEVTQMKGDGEAHPSFSKTDEFADFETWDKGSFGGAKDADMLPREYAREALKRGMQYEEKLGVNPWKFGMIGSTDSHTTLTTSTEDNYFGKVSAVEPGQEPARLEEMITGYLPDPQGRDYAIYHKSTSASGLAAVWAHENTREAIWDAMQRKEVFATTGTRLKVRMFGGWSFDQKDLARHDMALYAYNNGVPMGGDLTSAAAGKVPGFLIQAAKDPDWANLDRIQVIKGWVDSKGETQERVYDVSVSDGRKIGRNGRCKTPVGNTVNVAEAAFDNSIGATSLQAYWQDPDFDARERAFYYVRVLEIPTPRWTTFDAKYLNKAVPEGVPTSIQERAYTTPIWYTP